MAEQKNQDLNQLLKIRRDKLAELQANGKDPFQITKFNQTHHSLEVKNLYEAHEAELLKDRTEPEDVYKRQVRSTPFREITHGRLIAIPSNPYSPSRTTEAGTTARSFRIMAPTRRQTLRAMPELV